MRALTIIIAVLACACGPTIQGQKTAIRDARIGIASLGIGLEAGDQGSTEYFATFPAEDTEKYCQGEIVLAIFKDVRTGLVGLEDGTKLWETAIAVYETRKQAGEASEVDWQLVLSSNSDWMKIALDVLAELNVGMEYAEHSGATIPPALRYAWKMLYGLTGKGELPEPGIDWGDLKTGVCAPYLPGGAP